MVQLSDPYMTTGKTIALTRRTFVGKMMSLLFNKLSRFVIASLPRSKSPQDWTLSVSFHLKPEKGNAKQCSNYRTIALISLASKVMLKILQVKLQQDVNRELPDVQAGFRKGRETRDRIANIHWIIEKASEFQKNIFCFIDYNKAFGFVDHNKLKNSSRDGNTRPPDLPRFLTWETYMQVKKQQLEPDTEQRTGSKLSQYVKPVHCHPAYLTCMQSTCEMLGWMMRKLESRLPGEILIMSDMWMTSL